MVVAMAAGALALSFKGILPNNLFIVAAAIIAPLFGLLLAQKRPALGPVIESEAET